MELNEAARRVFRLHWRLIALCVAASLAAFLVVGFTRARTYTSSARIVLDTPDPQNLADATAIADTARGIATGSDAVEAALSQVGVHRDPIKFAKKDINVQPIGSSGVLKLSVTDKNASVSAGLANALASQVIVTRIRINNGRTTAALDQNIATLRGELDRLDARIATADSAATATTLTQTRADTQSVLNLLITERTNLSSQIGQPTSAAGLVPVPSVIQVATTPVKADPSEVPPLGGLGLLLGLVLGIGFAAGIEATRPTLVGGDTVAAALGVMHLADIPKRKRARGQRVAQAAERIYLGGEAIGVRAVELLPVGSLSGLPALAEDIEWELRMLRLRRRPAHAGEPGGLSGSAGAAVDDSPMRRTDTAPTAVRPFDTAASDRAAAIVIVSPSTVRKSVFDDTVAMSKLLRKPVLGVITYHALAKRAVARAPHQGAHTQRRKTTGRSAPDVAIRLDESGQIPINEERPFAEQPIARALRSEQRSSPSVTDAKTEKSKGAPRPVSPVNDFPGQDAGTRNEGSAG